MATNQMMQAGAMVYIPAGNIIQPGQAIPASVISQPGAVHYVSQQPGSASNQPQNNQAGPLQKLLKVETKSLGAVQIVIGIVHFCFGAVSASISGPSYTPVAAISGYPFWGALFFIASGSLSVSVEKHLRVGLVKCSVGMNITSAVMSVIGIMLYISELAVNSLYYDYDYRYYWLWSTGTGLGVLLLLFSLLEFAITVSAAHFGCQATCCHHEPATVFVPYTVSGNAAVDNPLPPSYDNHTFSPKYEP